MFSFPHDPIDEDALALHFEVALAAAAPELLDGLGDADRYRRRAAYADTARHLAERMRCFDVQSVDAKLGQAQPSLSR
ncbi:hypothetical protein E6W36_01700 [Hankyongella ginsenosidimutans]|uniref:Uncharacterized protein n=1 Tax=Hankyongella ginsenosidimutans TaxID=1763828 RepID=A0A4D7C5E3_9SPHN|nr:hypothetical protein [Hankyongella ginsenosidimutans]QCI78795.1 hypothetical protein E6W36_01700 [Hankyongella ginsenosidimutans]